MLNRLGDAGAPYGPDARTRREDATIRRALRILDSRLRAEPDLTLNRPEAVAAYLRLRLARQAHESFLVLFLDTQNRLLAAEVLFEGTLNQTAVYPREVLRAVLAHGAASVVLAHNHPSGSSAPSDSDVLLTRKLSQALALIDVRVLDHVIVAGRAMASMAQLGIL